MNEILAFIVGGVGVALLFWWLMLASEVRRWRGAHKGTRFTGSPAVRRAMLENITRRLGSRN